MRHRRLAILALSGTLLNACTAQAPPTWAFEPKPDDFKPDALLDLRFLNEKVAGQSGFVKVDPGGDFITGDGKPLRFWAINTGVEREKPFQARPQGRQTEALLANHARFMAKRGVNMVRLHSHLEPSPDQAIDDINTGERDWIWRTVAAMKKEGIYTTISPYWGVTPKFSDKWGIPGGKDQSALGLLFFDPTLQKAYKTWLKRLFAETNPATGIPLSQDASVAIIQIQNEDSLLFWTVNGIKGPQRENLERLYAKFLAKKYGNSAAPKSWQGVKDAADQPGKFGILNVWELTQARDGGMQARLADQLEFLSRTMFDFSKEIVRYLREDLGCKQLVNAGNWRTADAVRLNDAERWSYTSADVDAVNRYFGGVHKGVNQGWAIEKGDTFTAVSALVDPKPFPLNLKQTSGRPMLVTESSWVFPNTYAAEGPFLISAYQSLSGVDAFYWFATGDDQWTAPQSANGYANNMMKWAFATPDTLGTFPGAALMYREAYIKRAAPVVLENRSLSDLWLRKTPVIAESDGFDPNRDAGDITQTSSIKTGVSPMAYFVGPVQVKFDADPAASKALGLAPYVTNGLDAKSQTGEVELNAEKNYCTVNSPCAQGVTAFFARKPVHKLADVTFNSRNPYGAALAVSLDGKPIAESGKVLVQYATTSRPTGWKEKTADVKLDDGKVVSGYEVLEIGKAPWRVVSADLDVSIRNPKLTKATQLDSNGNAVAEVKVEKTADGLRFAFPANALYVVLR